MKRHYRWYICSFQFVPVIQLKIAYKSYRKPVSYKFFTNKLWRRKLKNFEGDGDEKFGVTPSETHLFWPICLLTLDNFATFLYFSILFFFLFGILGGTFPSWKILARGGGGGRGEGRGWTCPPVVSAACANKRIVQLHSIWYKKVQVFCMWALVLW